MRSFLIAIALATVCSCARPPHIDLRHPIYMVTDQSFWSGCNKYPAGYKACRAFRIKQVNDGINQWFDYFDRATRPRVTIVSSEKELPFGAVNEAIRLRIEAGFCDKGKAACYVYGPFSLPEIVFVDPSGITPILVAHEFGHALGLDHVSITGSVMFFQPYVPVTLSDIKTMCKLHRECQMLKVKRRK